MIPDVELPNLSDAVEGGLARLVTELTDTHKGVQAILGSLQNTSETVRHQMNWAAIHLHAAMRAMAGQVEMVDLGDELPEGSDRSGPAGPSFGDAIRGHTKSIGIGEILGFIASLRKTGTLVVRGRNENFLVELKEGSVVYAQGDNPPPGLLLGEILTSQGAIDPEELKTFLAANPSRGNMLGSALLSEGLIQAQALRIALSFQIQHLFHRLFEDDDAYYQFEENATRISDEDVRLNVQQLLLESARQQDEAGSHGPGAKP